jgi:protein TonB
VAHAVSAFYVRSDHMSPLAAFLAAALHVTTALALFWVSPLNRHDLDDDAVEITMEQPKPAETPPEKQPEKPPVQEAVKPPPPPPAPTPQPTPPAAEIAPPPPPPAAAAKPESKAEAKSQAQASSDKPLGVSPPAPAAAEPPKQGGSAPEPQKEAAASSQQEAAATPPPPAPPAPAEPPLEKVLPPVEAPRAPLTMRDFVRVLPPPSMPSPSAPQGTPQRSAPQQLQQSPPSPAPQPQTPSSASVSTFVNPAEDAAHTRAKEAYLWQVLRKFSQYLPNLRDKNEGGTVVLRFVIGRDGRLVDASIVQSSGVAALDKGLLESLRAASPYPPLPPEISGDHVVFTQPIAAKH